MKKEIEKNKAITTLLKTIDTNAFNAMTSSSNTLSLTGFALLVLLISTSTARGLSIGKKVLFEIIIKNYNKYGKQYEKDQLTIKSFDNLYRKFLQDNLFDKCEYECLFNTFTEFVDENKHESVS